MAEKDRIKATLITKVEAAKSEVAEAKRVLKEKELAFKEAVKDLAKVAPLMAWDYSGGYR